MNRSGNRKKRSSFQRREPALGYYFVFTDTNRTEENYLYGLRDSLPTDLQKQIVIKVSKTKTESLVSACREQASLEPQFAQPWIVFDRDRVVDFDKTIAEAKRAGIHVGWSNPCLEIWFDAYLGRMHSYMDSVACCHGFGETFRKLTGHDYSKASRRIYELLNRFGDEKAAIQMAERRLQQYQKDGVRNPSEMCPCTTLHRLVREIRDKAECHE